MVSRFSHITFYIVVLACSQSHVRAHMHIMTGTGGTITIFTRHECFIVEPKATSTGCHGNDNENVEYIRLRKSKIKLKVG